ncbi:MAG: tetraacyldisaccharide 4'-kinase [Cellvibrionales bacterium]|nr:tetraacyldisaccharide 4'-kinase [Cellvibrionales bacterium]|tara:strand:+ start:729 stop:1856 length:1128 start_codon:yes stop_codon:yes gene_type:complete
MSLSKRQAERLITGLWYYKSPLGFLFSILFMPLSILYWLITYCFRIIHERMRSSSLVLKEQSLPVIVVGNISVGGTGKTPIIINLAKQLIDAGYQPAIISRGYGGIASGQKNSVTSVFSDSDPGYCGEEPVLIAQSLKNVPVIISASRASAYLHVVNTLPCNVVLSDDGLQHYQLPRSIEIAVIDSKQGLGNGLLIPSGPLRERVSRLKKVDHIIVTGSGQFNTIERLNQFSKKSSNVITCIDAMREIEPSGHTLSYSSIDKIRERLINFSTLHMVAGIGNPDKFFTTVGNIFLASKSMPELLRHDYNDHHRYTLKDAHALDAIARDEAIIVTAKDAVKLQALDYYFQAKFFVIDIEIALDTVITKAIINRLNQK